MARLKIEAMVAFMETIARDDKHGYDQLTRTGGTDFDCSSLLGTAANRAGFKEVPEAATTRTLKDQLLAAGFKEIPLGSPRQRGDVFLRVGHHVVVCTDANNIVHASINEKGTATGGQPGDQTGKEICIRPFYQYKAAGRTGWDHAFRYEGNVTEAFPYWSKVSAVGVAFRSEPRIADSTLIKRITPGHGMTVGEPAKGIFSPVEYEGRKGWVATKYLTR